MDENILSLHRKYDMIMGIDETDKDRIKNLVDWVANKGIDLILNEKIKKDLVVKQKEIWTCDFGYNIGSEMNKTRPVVILQSNAINKNSNTIVVAPITSRIAFLPSHVKISNKNLEYVEENVEGIIMLEQIKTISKARLGRRIGKINDETFEKVKESLFRVILDKDEVFDFVKVENKYNETCDNIKLNFGFIFNKLKTLVQVYRSFF